MLAFGLGIRGHALGHAASYVFASIVALLVLRGRLGGLEVRGMASSLGRTIIAATMTALAAWATSRAVEAWLGTETLASQVALVFLPIAVGLAVFLLGALIFRIEEVDTVKRQLLSRQRR